MRRNGAATLSIACLLVLSLACARGAAVERNAAEAIGERKVSFRGSLRVLAVDFLPPKEPETLYYLQLSSGPVVKLQLPESVAQDRRMMSGAEMRVVGSTATSSSRGTHGEVTVLVDEVEWLPRRTV